MKERPVVSIVTPCRDAVETLGRCLDSISQQDYPHIEHIVIDGDSNDGTVDLLQQVDGIRWVSERDSGQSEALNKGFALATGQILAWLNADDELLPGAVGRVVDAFAEHVDAGWIYGRAVIRGGSMRSRVEPVTAISNRDLEFGNPIVQPSTFLRRTVLETVGSLDTTLHLAMDLDLWLRLIHHRIPRLFLPDVLARMTYDQGSKTTRIDRTEFMKENFLVYLKNGWIDAAYLALGAIASYRAMKEGLVRKTDLDQEVTLVTEWARGFLRDVARRNVQAAAAVEACFAEQHVAGGLRSTALRHLLSPAPWMYNPARRRIAHGITKKVLAEALASKRISLPQTR